VSTVAIVALLAYFVGSVPSGYLAGRLAGVDIRKTGSGNIGATNVLRILGKPFGYAVFLVDFGKGLVAELLAVFLTRREGGSSSFAELCAVIAGMFAVIGHSCPVWLRFRGGKGVATSVGVLFGIAPLAAVVMCAVWAATFLVTRYVSIASIAAALALPVAVGALRLLDRHIGPVVFYFSLCLAAVVIVRHRSNLFRLWHGTEPRFRRK
jgi:glycerol-3-phosphate acyltransferase PlsY